MIYVLAITILSQTGSVHLVIKPCSGLLLVPDIPHPPPFKELLSFAAQVSSYRRNSLPDFATHGSPCIYFYTPGCRTHGSRLEDICLMN